MSETQTEISEESDVCQVVIETVATAEGVDPLDLSPPLYEVIDPAALENLFADGRSLGKVVFNYNNYEVSVFSGEYVSVENYGRQPQLQRG